MAILRTVALEANSVTNGLEVTTNNFGSGTAPTIVTSPIIDGTYCMKNSTATTNSSAMYQFSSGGISKIFIHSRFYIKSTDGYPSANCCILDLGTAAAAYGAIYMNASGQCGINYNVGTTSTYDSTLTSAVSFDTPHTLDLVIDTSTANVQVISGYLDGVLINTVNGSRTLAANSLTLGVWGVGLRESTLATVYFDDIVINDGTGSSMNGLGTDMRVVRYTPSSAGDSNTFATQTGGTAGAGNNFTRVSEITPDSATTFNGSNTNAQSDFYGVSGPTIPSGATINYVELFVWYRASTASAEASFKLQIKKTSGGTISQSAAITPNSTTFKANANAVPVNSPLILYNDPDGSPWTPTTVASMQIGMAISTGNTNRADISTIWAYVNYTLVSGTDYNQPESDSVTSADATVISTDKKLSDSVTASDSESTLAAYIRALSDSATASETHVSKIVKPFADSVISSDSIVIITGKHLSDSVTASDSSSHISVYIRGFTDSVTSAEAHGSKVVTPRADTVTISDTPTTATGKSSSQSDSVTASDSSTTVSHYIRGISDSVSSSEAIKKAPVKPLSDTATSSDASLRAPVKKLSDSITTSDSHITTAKKGLSDSVTTSDTNSKAIITPRSDSATATDVSVHKPAKNLSDTSSVADTRISKPVLNKSDSVTTSDSPIFHSHPPFSSLIDDFHTGSTPGAQWQTSGDGTTLVSGKASINTTSHFFFSTLGSVGQYDLSDSAILVQIVSIPTADSFPPQASFNIGSFALSSFGELAWDYDYTSGSWAATDPATTLAHAPTGSAIWLRIRNVGGTSGTVYWDYSTDGITYVNAASETMAALTTANSGTPVPITALYANYYNSEGNTNGTFVIDNVNGLPPTAWNQPLSDNAVSSDSIVIQTGKHFADSLTTSDNQVRKPTKMIADTVTSAESHIAQPHKMIADIASSNDSSSRQVHKSLADSVNTGDIAAPTGSKTLSLSDSVMVTDSAEQIFPNHEALSDSVTISEAISKILVKPFVETLSTADSRTSKVIRNISDGITTSENTVKPIVMPLTDTVNSADAVTKNTIKFVTDSITTSDTIRTGHHLDDSVEVLDLFRLFLNGKPIIVPTTEWYLRPVVGTSMSLTNPGIFDTDIHVAISRNRITVDVEHDIEVGSASQNSGAPTVGL